MKKSSVIVLGSANRNGNTGELVDYISKKFEIRVIDVSDYNITPFDYEHKNLNDDFIPLMKEIVEYDQMILASPVYWYSSSAQLKTFIDRFSDLLAVEKDLGRKLKGKDGFVISTGYDEIPYESFESHFIATYKYLKMNYKGMIYCHTGDKFVLDNFKDKIDKQVLEFITE